MQNKLKVSNIQVYTDGSCNTKFKVGAWASIILINEDKIVLNDKEFNTTNNRMELLAVIKSVNYIVENIKFDKIEIFSDSQYVVNLVDRKEKLTDNEFITKKGNILNNSDLLQELIKLIETYSIEFVKVKAHQKEGNGSDYNILVDKLSRKIVRSYLAINNDDDN